jgi:hypothetical protein
MADQDCDFTGCFHLSEFFLEPGKLITRVLSITHQVEIGAVAGLSIDSNNINVVVDFVIGSKLLGVETIDQEFFQGGFVKPDFPVVGEERDNGILFIEVHRVDHHAEVVITFKRECGPLAQVLLHVVE